VTLKLAEPVSPAESVASPVTAWVPSGKKDPDEGEQVTGSGPSSASQADVEKVTVSPSELHVRRRMSAGTVTTGFVALLRTSRTVTVTRSGWLERLPLATTSSNVSVEVALTFGAVNVGAPTLAAASGAAYAAPGSRPGGLDDGSIGIASAPRH
jgi:hypothetical protein